MRAIFRCAESLFPAGIEPATCTLEGYRSIQLSYGNAGLILEGTWLPRNRRSREALLRQRGVDRLANREEVIADLRRRRRVELLADRLGMVVTGDGVGDEGRARGNGVRGIGQLSQERALRRCHRRTIADRINRHAQRPGMPRILTRLPVSQAAASGCSYGDCPKSASRNSERSRSSAWAVRSRPWCCRSSFRVHR